MVSQALLHTNNETSRSDISNFKNDFYMIFTHYLEHLYFPCLIFKSILLLKGLGTRMFMTVVFISLLGLQNVLISAHLIKYINTCFSRNINRHACSTKWSQAGLLFLALCLWLPSGSVHACDLDQVIPFHSESTFLNIATMTRQAEHLSINIISSALWPLPTGFTLQSSA